MFKKSFLPLLLFSLLTAALLAFSFPQLTTAAESSAEVIAAGLNNPRGLAFAADGSLLVAEAGVGGDGPCIPGAEGEDVCFGHSGSIMRIHNGQQDRIITGLSSLAPVGGGGATGPHDIDIVGNLAYIPVGLGADPAVLNDPAGLGGVPNNLGQLVQAHIGTGDYHAIGNLAAHEGANDPNGEGADSNPYGVLGLFWATFGCRCWRQQPVDGERKPCVYVGNLPRTFC